MDPQAYYPDDLGPDYGLSEAIREIEAAATGSGLLQPGAAFALGCLGLAGDAQPGWTVDDLAAALQGKS